MLEDDGAGRQLLEAEETVEFAFLHLHKTLRTRLLVTLVRFARPALCYFDNPHHAAPSDCFLGPGFRDTFAQLVSPLALSCPVPARV